MEMSILQGEVKGKDTNSDKIILWNLVLIFKKSNTLYFHNTFHADNTKDILLHEA